MTPTVSYFQWEEHDGGSLLLREQGPLLGVESGVRLNLLGTGSGQALILSGRGGLFGGWTYYDGHTQQTNIPVTTDVTYVGGRAGFDLGWSLPISGSALEPLVGIDYRAWVRDLHDSTAADGSPVSGYSEVWQNAAVRTGLRWYGAGTGDGLTFFAAGGAEYPFYTTNQVDVSNYGTLTLKPRGEWSAFGEMGIRSKRLRIAVNYEGLRFGRSAVVLVSPSKGYLQPDSRGDIIGISVGYCFR